MPFKQKQNNVYNSPEFLTKFQLSCSAISTKTENSAFQRQRTMHFKDREQCISKTENNAFQRQRTMHFKNREQCISKTENNAFQRQRTMHFKDREQCISKTENNAFQRQRTMEFLTYTTKFLQVLQVVFGYLVRSAFDYHDWGLL